MKINALTARRFRLACMGAAVLASLAATTTAHAQTNNYFGTSGTLSSNVYSTNPAGPYTSAFATNASGGILNFGNVATFTGGSIILAGINATANATDGTPGGTISNFNNGVIPISVNSGVTLDFGSQSFTTSATAGYIKNGTGVLALAGATYGGGFTLNAGTVVVRGVNAFGTGALTLNGGIVASNASRDLTGKYTGITIGGDVQFGALAANSALASDTASLMFSNNVTLGSATRTITIGNNGTDTFNSVISGAAGVGLTVDALSGATGNVVLGGANTFTGTFKANAGTTNLAINNALGGVSAVSIVSGAKVTSVLSLTNAINDTAAVTLNGILDLSGGTETVGSLAGTSTSASLVIGKNGSTAGGCTVGDSTNQSFAAVISGTPLTTGATIFTKQGSGTLILSGANTYTGGTTISAGTLQFAKTTAMSANSAVSVSSGATLAVNVGSGTSDFTNATSGNGSIGGLLSGLGGQTGSTVNFASGSILGIDTTNAGGSLTYSGNISNTGLGLTKLGAGELIYNGSKTATGPNTVSAGTLGGTGTLAGATTVAPGGTITGATTGTIGTLSFPSTLTINGTYVADVSGTSDASDKLQTSGLLTLGTNSTLTIGGMVVTATDPLSTVYVLATYGLLSGTFANFTAPSGYAINYGTATSSGQITLEAIPEPETWLGGFFLLGTVAYSQRRRLVGLVRLAKAA